MSESNSEEEEKVKEEGNQSFSFLSHFPNIKNFDQFIQTFSIKTEMNNTAKTALSLSNKYFILIQPNSSLILPNKSLGISNDTITEILNFSFSLKEINAEYNHLELYTYYDYSSYLTTISSGDSKEAIRDKIINKTLSYKSDIKMSLSSLFNKITINNDINSKDIIKNKFAQIIIFNNNNKENIGTFFTIEDIKDVLSEFTSAKYSDINGIQIHFLFNSNYYFDKNIRCNDEYKELCDYLDDPPNELSNIIKLNQRQYIPAKELSDKLSAIFTNEVLSNENFKKYFKNIETLMKKINEIYFAILNLKGKIWFNEKKSTMIEKLTTSNYISTLISKSLTKNIISSVETDCKAIKDKINRLNISSITDSIKNSKLSECLYWDKIANYLINQEQSILSFISLVENIKNLFSHIQWKIEDEIEIIPKASY